MAKHAGATRCEIRVRLDLDGRLVVEGEDDGAGGAVIVPGGGYPISPGGLKALDGTLELTSPAGGPTVVRATITVPRAGLRTAILVPLHGSLPVPLVRSGAQVGQHREHTSMVVLRICRFQRREAVGDVLLGLAPSLMVSSSAMPA